VRVVYLRGGYVGEGIEEGYVRGGYLRGVC
jgi:hypothetical protein